MFNVTDQKGKATAAVDIKTAHVVATEVGHWASARHRGVITNATKVLINGWGKAILSYLHATVRPDNEASGYFIKTPISGKSKLFRS